MKKLLFVLPVFIMLACDSGKQKPAENKTIDTVITETQVLSVPEEDTAKYEEVELPKDLAWFQNIEQVDFCVPIPYKDYSLDQSTQRQRGDFLFVNNADSTLKMQLMGMFRANPKISIEEYFKNSYSPEETEAKGKIITEKKITGKYNCFYAKGYMNNLKQKERFMEIYWFRKEDVVKLSASFSIKDTSTWNDRLKVIIQTDSYCH